MIVPDVVFQLTRPKGAKRLLPWRYTKDEDRPRRGQLLAYLDVIHQEAIERDFGFGDAVQVLAVFDTEAGDRLMRDASPRIRPSSPSLRYSSSEQSTSCSPVFEAVGGRRYERERAAVLTPSVRVPGRRNQRVGMPLFPRLARGAAVHTRDRLLPSCVAWWHRAG